MCNKCSIPWVGPSSGCLESNQVVILENEGQSAIIVGSQYYQYSKFISSNTNFSFIGPQIRHSRSWVLMVMSWSCYLSFGFPANAIMGLSRNGQVHATLSSLHANSSCRYSWCQTRHWKLPCYRFKGSLRWCSMLSRPTCFMKFTT